jgi:7 transmembrane receptor (rhodopsin family)
LSAKFLGWFLGSGYCSVLIFALYIFEAGIRNCHTLISINRIWAVFWPHSYRQYHKKRVACLLCLAGWLEVQFIILPGFILDALYYRSPLIVNPCFLNAMVQWDWSVAIQFTVYNMGLYLMWLSYPIIWFKRRQRQKIGPNSTNATSRVTSRVSAANTATPSVRAAQSVDEDLEEGTMKEEGVVVKSGNAAPQRQRSSHAFTILTVLTISVTICWTPILCYYTITLWIPIGSPLLLEIGTVLFALQSVMDPVLFVIALPDLRETFRRALRI